jgi:DNA-binding LacI/PurR family transcriptional regulator
MARRPPAKQGKADRKHSVTVLDVAQAVGVSAMTVSRYVNGHLSKISLETQRRIAAAIGELNYRPHASARGLRLAQRWSIALLIVDTSPTFLADPFITHLVAGLTNFLNRHGYALSIQSVAPDRVAEALPLRDIQTDGICVMPSGSREQRSRIGHLLESLGQPVVWFQEHMDSVGADSCRIVQDDFGGGFIVAQHVIEQGAQRLVLLAPGLEWPAVVEREKGIRAAIRKSGTRCDLIIVRCGNESSAETQAALTMHLNEFGMPDAVIAGNDQMAIAAIQLLKSRSAKIPRDVMVTGFNAFDFRGYYTPLLTSVASPAYAMGERGGQELIRRLANGRFAERSIILPVRFQPGETTRGAQSFNEAFRRKSSKPPSDGGRDGTPKVRASKGGRLSVHSERSAR